MKKLSPVAMIAALCAVAVAVDAARGQGCEPGWSADIAGGGMTYGTISTAITFDADGAGPQEPVLVIGGQFSRVGEVEASSVAALIDGEWQPLGTGLPSRLGLPGGGVVADLAEFDEDGAGPLPPRLFAVGSFGIDGVQHRAARWNGTSWTGLGSLVGPSALRVVDADGPGPGEPGLYALDFRSVKRWDGSAWVALGFLPTMAHLVADLEVYDPDGPMGPQLPELHAATSDRVRRFDGTTWQLLPGQTIGSEVNALEVFDKDGAGPEPARLFAGGSLTVTGAASSTLVTWDGASWSDAGAGPEGFFYGQPAVTDLRVVTPPDGTASLYVAGRFASAGGVPARGLARWDGTAWFTVSGAEGDRIAVDGTRVIIASQAAVAVSEGGAGAWERVTPPIDGPLRSFDGVSFDPDGAGPRRPQLVVAGELNGVDGMPSRSIAALDADGWHDLGGGLSVPVQAITAVNGPSPGGMERAVFVTMSVPGVSGSAQAPLTQTAAWDGQQWRSIGEVDADVLTAWDPDGPGPQGPLLVAGGPFSQADGVTADMVAVWDGTAWAPLGGGLRGATVRALTSWDEDGDGPLPPRLVAGGLINMIGGLPGGVANIAVWNGAAWAPMGAGLSAAPGSPAVRTLAVFDLDGAGPLGAEVIAGGPMTASGSTTIDGVARWTGTAWEQVGAGFQLGSAAGSVTSLAVVDLDGDGPAGPALLASGSFDRSGDGPLRNVESWDGTAWADIGGLSPGAELWGFDPDGDGPAAAMLTAGGILDEAGGLEAPGLARYGSPAPVLVGGPAAVSARRTHSIEIPLAVLGAGPLDAAWSRGGAPVADGATPEESVYSGAGTATLRIDNVQVSDAGVLGFAAGNACGSISEPLAAVLVIACPADWNADGAVNSSDISAFLGTWLEAVGQGHRAADVDASGGTTSSDITAFLTLWLEGVQEGC